MIRFIRYVIDKIKAGWWAYKHPGQLTSYTYRKYPRESTFQNKRVLNLGCGSSTYPVSNVVNLDFLPGKEIDVVHDLSKPLPFKDEEFDFIIANHILEHVPDWWDCFKECARILKTGGKLEVWIPGDGNSSQLGYRDHINVINHCSFMGVQGTMRNQANIWEAAQDKTHTSRLSLLHRSYTLNQRWWIYGAPDGLISWMIEHLRNIVSEQGFLFTKLKPGEKPRIPSGSTTQALY